MPALLACETSPYLQQHADDSVDWFAWKEVALRLAREQFSDQGLEPSSRSPQELAEHSRVEIDRRTKIIKQQ